MKRVSGPSALASTRAMIRSTRLQLAAPSKNSLKRRALPSFGAASKRAFVLASRRCAGATSWSARRPGYNRDLGPVGPDRPQQAAQEGTNLLATRPFGGAKHSRDEAAFAVEHDNRLETVFVVMRIEQP